MVQRYGPHWEDRMRPPQAPPALAPAIYDILADLSEGGGFILRGSPKWGTISPLVGTLARNVNVTADAYRHWDLDRNEQYFLQWCTAMASFKARLADGTRVQGGQLLFVEGWNDVLVPGRREPLTNSIWREVLCGMRLEDLKDRAIAPGLGGRRLRLSALWPGGRGRERW
jgi:hypothetical protein